MCCIRAGSGVAVMRVAAFTTLCSCFRSAVVQLPVPDRDANSEDALNRAVVEVHLNVRRQLTSFSSGRRDTGEPRRGPK